MVATLILLNGFLAFCVGALASVGNNPVGIGGVGLFFGVPSRHVVTAGRKVVWSFASNTSHLITLALDDVVDRARREAGARRTTVQVAITGGIAATSKHVVVGVGVEFC